MKFKRERFSVQEMFERWVEPVEKYLIRAAVVGVLLLVIAQGLMYNNTTEFYMGFSQLLNREVAQFDSEYPQARVTGTSAAFATVTLKLTNYSSLQKAKLLVNGKEVTDFRDSQVTIRVNPGDEIAVDGSFYTHQLNLVVAAVSENIGVPATGEEIVVRQNVVTLPTVKLVKK